MNWIKKIFGIPTDEEKKKAEADIELKRQEFIKSMSKMRLPYTPPSSNKISSTNFSDEERRRRDDSGISDIISTAAIASTFDWPSTDNSTYDTGSSSSDSGSSSDSSFDGFGGGDFGGGGSSGDF